MKERRITSRRRSDEWIREEKIFRHRRDRLSIELKQRFVFDEQNGRRNELNLKWITSLAEQSKARRGTGSRTPEQTHRRSAWTKKRERKSIYLGHSNPSFCLLSLLFLVSSIKLDVARGLTHQCTSSTTTTDCHWSKELNQWRIGIHQQSSRSSWLHFSP